MSSAVEQGRPSKLKAAASFALMGLLGVLPDGKTARWYSITTEKKHYPEQFREDLAHLLALLRDGKIHPLIAERRPLREAQRAHELIEHARVAGKIVLVCQE